MPKDPGCLRPLVGAIAISLAPLASGCGLLEPPPDVIEMPAQPAEVVEVEPAPLPEPALPEPEPAAPAPPPEPAPDPEALAQAREEAARAAFEAEYPWHGVAYHFLAQVHRSPNGNSPVVGYMRRGATFRAQPPLRGPGCARGWSRVPGDGFVCRGNGFDLGDTPQSFDPSPVAPARSAALPYAYAWVVRPDAPQYWRLPTEADEEQARAWIARERARENAPPPPPPSSDDDEESTNAGPQEGLEAPPGLDDEPAREPGEPTDGGIPEADAGPQLDERPSFLRMRMRRGFYISVDRLETVGNRRFYRTVRGGFVPADVVAEASPPEMRGVVVGGRWSLPLGFVYRGGVRTLRRDPSRGVLAMADPIARLTPLPLQEETVRRGQRQYRISDRGQIVREDALRIARVIERPEGVAEDERWIHVDVSEQVLVAYNGDEPVFATLVSTGREGNETPIGTFRIQSKHVSTTMDDPNAGADSYSIEDVPWTMYFEGSYALHGAFWHDRFGRVRSHGCVNLAPADARWLFQWSTPTVPESWHGMSTRRGSIVHITE